MKAASTNHTNIIFRFVLISLGIILFAGAISAKLFNTTVIDAAKWNKKANEELQVTDTIKPQRGDILACDGSVLVTNLCYYTVRIDYRSDAFKEVEYLASVKSLSDSMALYFPVRSEEEWDSLFMKQMSLPKEERSRSFKVISGLTYEQLQHIKTFPFFNLKNRNKNGFIEESYMKRDCPYGDMARRSIGRVGQTEECDEIHGISGLEKALDSLLYGTPGIYKRVPFTRRIGNWTDIPAVDGYTVMTTIDITLQDILESELNTMLDSCGAEWGAAILMEVATGDIKAISNLELDRSTGEYIEAYNRAVVAYEPGSVIKPLSMMIALEDGLVSDLDEEIPIGSSYAYGGTPAITDSHFNTSLTVAGVIEESSNIGMTRIIVRGYDRDPAGFVRRLEGIGFLEKMNSGIFEEEKPRLKSDPKRIDLARMCYGYTTAVPPIYTLSIYNAIANGGRYVRPRLVKGLRRNGVDSILDVTYIRDSICSQKNAAKMREILSRVVEGKRGTGRRLKNQYVRIAGKTGTCYDINFATKKYDRSKKRLAFCGFFPADDPKYSCFVLTFHPTKNMFGAASTSGEVLKNVALKMYSRGMLGDSSDFHAEAASDPGRPRINATSTGGKSEELIASIGGAASQFKMPEGFDENNVPLVKNFGLRDAIVRLEQAGFEVKFTGTGRVIKQELVDDKTVMLTLSNK